MKTLKALARRLFRDKRAATALIFAISTPLVVGGAALAIDIAAFRIVHSRMQSAVDSAALAAVMTLETNQALAHGTAVNMVTKNIPTDFGAMTNAGDVTVGTYTKLGGFVPGGASPNAVRVVGIRAPSRNNGLNRIFGRLWSSEQMDVQVSAIAARPANVFYEPPQGVVMDSSAGDFNEMYAYCYDPAAPAGQQRTQMTLIANNLGPNQTTNQMTGGLYTTMPAVPMQWPDCSGKDQSLSFRLRNIRHAKNFSRLNPNNPDLWSNPTATISGRQPGRPEINHYTDTTINNGVETFNNGTLNILETMLCNTANECNPATNPNFPRGTNRLNTKSTNTAGCSPGKFVYFGFEDRPGGPGAKSTWLDPDWTDHDYNDIAIRMKCPSGGRLADPYPRLVG